jgi:isoquinoline 1-oxidoreductase beta subunit
MTALSRRRLFAHAARLAAGVTVFAAAPACAFNPLPALPTRGMPAVESRIAWLRLGPDGRVRLLLPRQEMGQGIAVALRQIVAEELDWELERVEAVLPDTAAIAPVKSTVGSDSLKDFAEPVARAAALLREHLASGGTAPEIVDRGQPVTLRSQARSAGARRHVGRPQPTEQIAGIVTGAALYAGDIRLPDMMFGLVLPADAALTGDDGDMRRVTLSDGRRGLLSAHPGPLHAAAARIDRDETPRPMLALDIDAVERRGRLEHRVRNDSLGKESGWTLDRRYDIPFAAHAAIEPRAAVARWHTDGAVRLEVWTGTQDAFFVRETLARHFGLAAEAVLVHSCRIGGGFGARTIVRQELEAALLAQAAGRPVKVQWTRAEEFTSGFHRPASSHRIRARLSDDGRIADWWHGFCSGHVIFTSAAMPRWMQAVTGFVKDPGVARGALPPYSMARARIEFSDIRLPVDTGPWRGLGAGPNGYAIESAIDELAALAGQDPLRFRLANLDPQHGRLRACLERVADLAGWDGPKAGRGLACGIYKESSYAAVIADVAVGADGAVRVTRLCCAHDCGPVINPDQVRAQIAGNLLWGLGMVLTERLPIEGGRVAAYTFADSPIPTMDAMPAIDIALIEPPDTTPSGAGETAMVAVAAIGNAIAAATGQRVTALPYRPA